MTPEQILLAMDNRCPECEHSLKNHTTRTDMGCIVKVVDKAGCARFCGCMRVGTFGKTGRLSFLEVEE